MSLSKYQVPDIKKFECDFEFDEKSLLSMPEPTLLGNLIDESNPFVKEGDQLCKSPTPKFTMRRFQMAQNSNNEIINEVNSVKRESKFKTASPSVIRKGLCTVRNEGEFIIFQREVFKLCIFSF